MAVVGAPIRFMQRAGRRAHQPISGQGASTIGKPFDFTCPGFHCAALPRINFAAFTVTPAAFPDYVRPAWRETYSASPSVRLRDDATFVNYYPGANAAALGYVSFCAKPRLAGRKASSTSGDTTRRRNHLLQAACLRFEQFEEQTIYLPMADLVQYGPEIFDDSAVRSWSASTTWMCWLASEWEEGLFHLFNRLRDTGRRLLLAASKSPGAAGQLPDLKSPPHHGADLPVARSFRRGQASCPCNCRHPVVACI